MESATPHRLHQTFPIGWHKRRWLHTVAHRACVCVFVCARKFDFPLWSKMMMHAQCAHCTKTKIILPVAPPPSPSKQWAWMANIYVRRFSTRARLLLTIHPLPSLLSHSPSVLLLLFNFILCLWISIFLLFIHSGNFNCSICCRCYSSSVSDTHEQTAYRCRCEKCEILHFIIYSSAAKKKQKKETDSGNGSAKQQKGAKKYFVRRAFYCEWHCHILFISFDSIKR